MRFCNRSDFLKEAKPYVGSENSGNEVGQTVGILGTLILCGVLGDDMHMATESVAAIPLYIPELSEVVDGGELLRLVKAEGLGSGSAEALGFSTKAENEVLLRLTLDLTEFLECYGMPFPEFIENMKTAHGLLVSGYSGLHCLEAVEVGPYTTSLSLGKPSGKRQFIIEINSQIPVLLENDSAYFLEYVTGELLSITPLGSSLKGKSQHESELENV